MKKGLLCFSWLWLATIAGAQESVWTLTAGTPPSVRNVLDKFPSILPNEKELAIYQLDWAPTLKDAKVRAGKERRPILLIVVTNSFGNMYTGHC